MLHVLNIYMQYIHVNQVNNQPFDAKFSLAPAATNVGLRSEMGLALQMLPPMVYKLIITISVLKVMYLHCSYILRLCLLIVKSLAVLLLCAFKGSTYTCTYVTGSGKTRHVVTHVQ